VILVIINGTPYEVATFRKDGHYLDGRRPESVSFSNEQEDAFRRDFTINALFYDPLAGELLDYVDGRTDLEGEILRAVGDPVARFREDRLRLLRAVRFAARFGYALEEKTFQAMKDEKEGIRTVKVERIREELIRMFTEGNADQALELLDESGLLEIVLPEVSSLKNVEQPPEFHPEGDVFVHTRLALSFLPQKPSAALALGVLFHDLGKPHTSRFHDGRIRFHGHALEGADIAWEICQRLRMSNKLTERIVWLVEHHMKIHVFPDMRVHKKKQLMREEGFRELLALARCDSLASHGDLSVIEEVEAWCRKQREEELSPPPLITGDDLIALGYKPDERFRSMLQAVEEAQLDGLLRDKGDALTFVEKHYPRTEK
jgi:poly(A) polymerase